MNKFYQLIVHRTYYAYEDDDAAGEDWEWYSDEEDNEEDPDQNEYATEEQSNNDDLDEGTVSYSDLNINCPIQKSENSDFGRFWEAISQLCPRLIFEKDSLDLRHCTKTSYPFTSQ